MANYLKYYVEGECERHFINTYKSSNKPKLKAGKVEVFNILNEKLSKVRVLSFEKGTILILVYDTDIEPSETFMDNISLLKANKNISKIYHVQSVKNFEDELVYSSDANKINEIFDTKGVNEFKHKFVNSKIESKLEKIGFKIELIWTRKPKNNDFSIFKQSGNFVKLK